MLVTVLGKKQSSARASVQMGQWEPAEQGRSGEVPASWPCGGNCGKTEVRWQMELGEGTRRSICERGKLEYVKAKGKNSDAMRY